MVAHTEVRRESLPLVLTSYFFEAGSLVLHYVPGQASEPLYFRGISFLSLPRFRRAGAHYMCYLVWLLNVGSGHRSSDLHAGMDSTFTH